MNLNFGEWVKKKMQNWLNIVPAPEQTITLIERTTFASEIIQAQLWYGGNATKLQQFFRQTDAGTSFWGSVPDNEKVRKIHSGLPAIIADTLAYIVCADLDKVDVDSTDWELITDAKRSGIDFPALVKKAIIRTLVCGDGAFKISPDTAVSPYPIVEFVSSDRVSYEYKRGILYEVIFRSDYLHDNRLYSLEERYGRGYIRSVLYNSRGKEIPLDSIPQTEGISSELLFDGGYIMAVPMRFYESEEYPNRGKSIFSGGRSDCFDALDEVISQWWDALRAGRVQKYIPECMIPRDPRDGSLRSVNSFGTEFITVESPMTETAERPKIEVVQPEIRYEAFLSTYTQALLMCLQGIVSPATLGIDVGKMSSAEAQREKKDVTGNTRNTITNELEKVLPQLISAILMTYDNMLERLIGSYDAEVSFGEYGAPDFDSRVETVGKASAYGVMSVETQANELWGSSKDDTWKTAEVQRIKKERGLTVDEPAVNDDAYLP